MQWIRRKIKVQQIGANADLVLFPDTNFFYHCYPVEQLDWSELKDFAHVYVVVSHPVQREIDGHKNKGSDRRAKKARAAASRILKILRDPTKEFIAHESGPRVHLVVKKDLKPPDKPDPRLDMRERDDQLVAIVQQYAKLFSKQNVRILTQDSGPVASAHMLGLEEYVIPDAWKLDPELDAGEKELLRLRTELNRLKKAEPSFELSFANSRSHESIESICIEVVHYDPLTDRQVNALMDEVRSLYPKATEFGTKTKSPKAPENKYFSIGKVWEPASDELIEKYSEDYEDWLAGCRTYFEDFNETLNRAQAAPSFLSIIDNVGTRPAKDALIEISVSDGIQLCVPYKDDEDDEPTTPPIPKPPSPPDGHWVSALFGIDGEARRIIQHDTRLSQDLFRAGVHTSHILSPPLADIARPEPRDPNGFFYKPRRPTMPTKTVTLECTQWRHAVEPEEFYAEIVVPPDLKDFSGAVTTRVHAENLSSIAKKTIGVQIRRSTASCLSMAKELIREAGARD
jgi:hypothetical protein